MFAANKFNTIINSSFFKARFTMLLPTFKAASRIIEPQKYIKSGAEREVTSVWPDLLGSPQYLTRK
jgi:hypothetical protein